jgi:hypothetical protein
VTLVDKNVGHANTYLRQCGTTVSELFSVVSATMAIFCHPLGHHLPSTYMLQLAWRSPNMVLHGGGCQSKYKRGEVCLKTTGKPASVHGIPS